MNAPLHRTQELLLASSLIAALALTACRSADRPTSDTAAPPAPAPPIQQAPSASPTEQPTASAAAPAFREVFPGVRVDLTRRIVEFDGFAALYAHDPQTPRIYLEQIVCTRNTREHESLVVTDVRPSNIHAALLLINLNPGHPTRWKVVDNRLTAEPPAGDRVHVELVYTDPHNVEHTIQPHDWIINANTDEHFPAPDHTSGWVFGGSRIHAQQNPQDEAATLYDADLAGTVIGLTSFGSEIIDWSTPISPEAQVTPPEWIADIRAYPAFNTPMKVRISPASIN